MDDSHRSSHFIILARLASLGFIRSRVERNDECMAVVIIASMQIYLIRCHGLNSRVHIPGSLEMAEGDNYSHQLPFPVHL